MKKLLLLSLVALGSVGSMEARKMRPLTTASLQKMSQKQLEAAKKRLQKELQSLAAKMLGDDNTRRERPGLSAAEQARLKEIRQQLKLINELLGKK